MDFEGRRVVRVLRRALRRASSGGRRRVDSAAVDVTSALREPQVPSPALLALGAT